MPVDREHVLTALRTVQDPELFRDIVTLGLVKDVRVEGPRVLVHVELSSANSPLRGTIERDIRTALARIGVNDVQLNLTARGGAPGAPGGNPAAPGAPRISVLPQVKKIIAVGAGKGGVGKSTLALNLAVGLQRTGLAVGLMDGDIYGPSMPTLLGIKGRTPTVRGPKIVPHYVHGLHAITIGSLVEQDKPLIWRGPMAHGAFKQLLLDNTEWPELDYLVVDLPPGTGDVPLTLCQLLPLTGAVVVATPQQVALDDAVRAVNMFRQLGAPVLGIVENMSYVPLPDGSQLDLFGRGGAERAAQQLAVPFLGALPMFPELRVNSDAGNPLANFEPASPLSKALETIVRNLQAEVTKRSQHASAPTLTVS